jgi:hypothetical protein
VSIIRHRIGIRLALHWAAPSGFLGLRNTFYFLRFADIDADIVVTKNTVFDITSIQSMENAKENSNAINALACAVQPTGVPVSKPRTYHSTLGFQSSSGIFIDL